MRFDNIRTLMKNLPAGYEAASRETGAIKRVGKVIKEPADLLWLMLTHLAQGQTLLNMSALSAASGLGAMSDVAIMKRLLNIRGWFKWILRHLATCAVADFLKPAGLEKYRLLAVDASVVKSGVSKFTKNWCLHYAFDVFALASHAFHITEATVGETLVNFKAEKGDLFVADRVYATLKGMAHCLSHQADFILRLRHNAFVMCDAQGARLDLLKVLASLPAGESLGLPVVVDLRPFGLGRRTLRVCALRKTEEAYGAALKRLAREDSKRQCERSAEALAFNAYGVVVTSLPDEIGAAEVLGAYRYRWQVELYFKRLKSLLGTGEVPKKRPECMEAWLNGKMILALLYEILLAKQDFPPLEG